MMDPQNIYIPTGRKMWKMEEPKNRELWANKEDQRKPWKVNIIILTILP